jgi:hypothetical protein
MRSRLLFSLAIAFLSLAACDTAGIGDLGSIGCPVDGCGPVEYWIVGLPLEKKSTAGLAQIDLAPGDSITLHYMSGKGGPLSVSDTMRTVNWGVSNTSAARITAGAGGSAALVAVAPGQFLVTVDGNTPTMWACVRTSCDLITQIGVIAPPAGRVSR